MALAFHDRKAIAQQEEHQKIKEYGESINEEPRSLKFFSFSQYFLNTVMYFLAKDLISLLL